MEKLFKNEHYELLLKALNVYRTVFNLTKENEQESEMIDDLIDNLFALHEKYEISDEKLNELLDEYEEMMEEYNEINFYTILANEIFRLKMEKKYNKDLRELNEKEFEEEYSNYILPTLLDMQKNGLKEYVKYE